MGLLDQIIGGVINSRMGGGGMSGGMGRSSGGGTSPLMMALMALLSSGALSGSGGLGGLLGGLTGGGESPGDRGRAAEATAAEDAVARPRRPAAARSAVGSAACSKA